MIPRLLEKRLTKAVAALDIELQADFCAQIEPAKDTRFGDYQSNTAMALAKQARMNPRELATKIIGKFDGTDLCGSPEIAGPGFINFRITNEFLSKRLASMHGDEKLLVPAAQPPQRIVVDFSSPNVAKQMHVGHLRTTVIGDCLARVARFLGHEVITDNHLGDWGTAFGAVIYGWKNVLDEAALEADPIAEMLRIYKTISAKAKVDPDLKEACKEELVKLQNGDPENLTIWKKSVDLTTTALDKIYERLDVHFDHTLGESAYNEFLAPLVEKLRADGIAVDSQGAVIIPFPDEPGLEENPAIIRKSDGGFNYTTTDLATIAHRKREWGADQIWYVVGTPQRLHFQQIFAAARKQGLELDCRHIEFGSVLGSDGKIIRTRDGESVPLVDMLDSAIHAAGKVVKEKNPGMSPEDVSEIAEIIGIGAVKYADLSQHRMSDYIYDEKKILSLKGNTAPYLMNAYVRCRAIFRKLEEVGESTGIHDNKCALVEPAERALGIKLAQFGEAVTEVLVDHRPNLLALYLFELAQTFHGFFEACRVRGSEGVTKNTRLMLCDVTARTLTRGLNLMGIQVPERM